MPPPGGPDIGPPGPVGTGMTFWTLIGGSAGRGGPPESWSLNGSALELPLTWPTHHRRLTRRHRRLLRRTRWHLLLLLRHRWLRRHRLRRCATLRSDAVLVRVGREAVRLVDLADLLVDGDRLLRRTRRRVDGRLLSVPDGARLTLHRRVVFAELLADSGLFGARSAHAEDVGTTLGELRDVATDLRAGGCGRVLFDAVQLLTGIVVVKQV